ncbi:hypothetical protein LC040_05285 [Bacillus tianshenii]|nr:hypothetical protein LC040_05285 [Bacillus tianshenii]
MNVNILQSLMKAEQPQQNSTRSFKAGQVVQGENCQILSESKCSRANWCDEGTC